MTIGIFIPPEHRGADTFCGEVIKQYGIQIVNEGRCLCEFEGEIEKVKKYKEAWIHPHHRNFEDECFKKLNHIIESLPNIRFYIWDCPNGRRRKSKKLDNFPNLNYFIKAGDFSKHLNELVGLNV